MAYTIEEMICEIEEEEDSIAELLEIIDLCEVKISNIRHRVAEQVVQSSHQILPMDFADNT